MSEIKTLNGYSLADTKARADIASLSQEIDEYFIRVEGASINRLNPDEVEIGKAVNIGDGTLYDAASYGTTGFIPVYDGEIITLQTGSTADASMMTATLVMAYICAYTEDKSYISSVSWAREYTVPAGARFIRISAAHFVGYPVWNRMVVASTDFLPYEPYSGTTSGQTTLAEKVVIPAIKEAQGDHASLKEKLDAIIKSTPGGFRACNLPAEWTSDFNNQDMCGYSMLLMADTPNGLTGSVSVGKGYQQYMGGYVKIDATTMYCYMGASESPYYQADHGLTIKDYIAIKLENGYKAKLKVTVSTNGGKYDKDDITWDVRKGNFFVKDISSDLQNIKFSYVCAGWKAATQMYGDSYFTVSYKDRWTSYLIADGATNFLINGYPGRMSATALESVKDVLEYSVIPDRIIWCMGMNDGDDGAVDTSWMACVAELEEICETKGIELILATIPNVPTVDNTYKNEYVRNSGHRYIDFASAVGASSSATWFENMLSSDNVHPDVQGAIALYNQALADVPELMAN